MKILTTTLICLLLTACTSTKVHLYTRYLSADEATKVTKTLEEQGFEVETNSLAFPDNIQQSALLYSPFVRGENRVNALIEKLKESGWTIPIVQPLFSGTHYYTKDSMGLLLLPNGRMKSDKVLAQELVSSYKAENCDSSIALQLNDDNTYQFSDSNLSEYEFKRFDGSWNMPSYPYLILVPDGNVGSFYFEIVKKTESDLNGKVELIELTPMDSHHSFPDCSFVSGVRI